MEKSITRGQCSLSLKKRHRRAKANSIETLHRLNPEPLYLQAGSVSKRPINLREPHLFHRAVTFKI